MCSRSVKPFLLLNIVISGLILVATVVITTLTALSCEPECKVYLLAIIPLWLFSIALIGLAVWCNRHFSNDAHRTKDIQISAPIPNQGNSLPYSYRSTPTIFEKIADIQQYPVSQLNHSARLESSRCSSRTSLYHQYRANHEFEKRLLMEPRYLDEQIPPHILDQPETSHHSRRYNSSSTVNCASSPRTIVRPLSKR